MGKKIQSRGPDSHGEWVCTQDGIGLSHRRLSILDLSPAGHQPMYSASQRFVIVFNGEIYNHMDLREELESLNPSIIWIGHSDTETLLAGIETWGLKTTLEKAIGMFSLALWDTEEKKLALARDRIGEKPLYYGWQNNVFFFGSQIKSFAPHPAFQPTINRSAIAQLLQYGYIPCPISIYENIYKLKQGTLLTLDQMNKTETVETYWTLDTSVHNKKNHKTETEIVTELESLLSDAIKQQMTADVPLGAFLSGGIDSSTIVALMQKQSPTPIKTFSIGFKEASYNEAHHAKAVAIHLKTDHTEHYITPTEAIDIIQDLWKIYDEPFADSSQIPTIFVAKLAKKKVTVALSGDAGDELFCGYNRYIVTHQAWRILSKLPKKIRTQVSKTILSISPSKWDSLFRFFTKKVGFTGTRLHKAAAILDASSIDDIYGNMISQCRHPEKFILGFGNSKNKTIALSPFPEDIIDRMMVTDLMTYLPDDILVKVDRAGMGTSLETRIPFLDHRVIEYAWSIPRNIKLKQGISKWPIRQILYKYVPKELIERPKMGFGIPIHDWLRGPLRAWGENLLSEEKLSQDGFFKTVEVRKCWQEHLDGKKDWGHFLWNILMFQLWHDKTHKISA